MKLIDLYPIAIIQDRYNGTYSGGAWIAVANYDMYRREEMLPANRGPWGDDREARNFWDLTTRWIAAGATPEAAFQKLCAQMLP